jgi:hypothetical protein
MQNVANGVGLQTPIKWSFLTKKIELPALSVRFNVEVFALLVHPRISSLEAGLVVPSPTLAHWEYAIVEFNTKQMKHKMLLIPEGVLRLKLVG